MSIRQTSLLSYAELIPKLGERQKMVYEALLKLGEGTDFEIARFLGFNERNCVAPRRFDLMKQGLVVEKCRRECKVSSKTAIVWVIK